MRKDMDRMYVTGVKSDSAQVHAQTAFAIGSGVPDVPHVIQSLRMVSPVESWRTQLELQPCPISAIFMDLCGTYVASVPEFLLGGRLVPSNVGWPRAQVVKGLSGTHTVKFKAEKERRWATRRALGFGLTIDLFSTGARPNFNDATPFFGNARQK